MKKIMITGASGFLGRYLISAFLSETENSIIALTSQPEKLGNFLRQAPERFLIFKASDFSSLSYAEIDILINCAFPRNEDGVKLADGLRFIADLLRTAVTGGVKAVINTSSQSVYSQQRTEPATEETPLNLESKYAVGKYADELLTNSICVNIPHTNLRMASLIGAGFDQRITNKLIDQALTGNDLHIMMGNQHYGFLDVRDAADAIVKICEKNNIKWNETYNLGNNRTYSLKDIADVICCCIKNKTGLTIKYTTEESNNTINTGICCDNYLETFGYIPFLSITETIDWIITEKIHDMQRVKSK